MISIKALFLDLQGVLHEGSTPVEGAREAVLWARQRGLVLRFVTNTATRSRAQLIGELKEMGLVVHNHELFTAPGAARRYLERHGMRPHCLVHPAISTDLLGPGPIGGIQECDCVVMGDAREALTYAALNDVFRLVRQGRPLIAIGMNRYFREDGEWMLDAGPFVRAIEWATGVEALVMGKPAPEFFMELVAGTGLAASECLMVGDDVEADVAGAMGCGLGGCLVRTGKFQRSDEDRCPAGALVIDSIADLPTHWDQAAAPTP